MFFCFFNVGGWMWALVAGWVDVGEGVGGWVGEGVGGWVGEGVGGWVGGWVRALVGGWVRALVGGWGHWWVGGWVRDDSKGGGAVGGVGCGDNQVFLPPDMSFFLRIPILELPILSNVFFISIFQWMYSVIMYLHSPCLPTCLQFFDYVF